MNKDIAEICGALIGDGWIESRGGSLYICGNKKEDRDYYDKHLIPLFSSTFHKVVGKDYPYWEVYGFGLHRKNIIEKISNLGIMKGKKVYDVSVPNWIFKDKKFMVSFLIGIFDTDGGIFCGKSYGRYVRGFRKKYHHDIRLRISSSSLRLIKGIERIGKKLSIEFTKIRLKKGNPNSKKS